MFRRNRYDSSFVWQTAGPEELLANRSRTLFLFGYITNIDGHGMPRGDEYSVHALCNSLICMAQESDEPIRLIIDSGGGSLIHAYMLYDTIKTLGVPVHTVVRMAASAATLISCAGEPGHRYIYPNSRVLLHQPAAHIGVVTSDESRRRSRELMDELRKLAQIYVDNGAVKSVEQIVKDLTKDGGRDKWMTSREFIEYGLADRVLEVNLFKGGSNE